MIEKYGIDDVKRYATLIDAFIDKKICPINYVEGEITNFKITYEYELEMFKSVVNNR